MRKGSKHRPETVAKIKAEADRVWAERKANHEVYTSHCMNTMLMRPYAFVRGRARKLQVSPEGIERLIEEYIRQYDETLD